MAKDNSKNRRRIMKAKINYLSLCSKGKNQIQTMYKSDDGENTEVTVATLIKGDMSEQGEITAVVYAPEQPDSDNHVASTRVIKEMAYDFAANGEGIDIRHNEKVVSKEDAFVAESFMIEKGSERFKDTKDYEGNPVDVSGGWGVVLKINNEEIRKAYRDGDWGGISMGGLAALKDDDSEVGKLTKALTSILNKCNPRAIKVNKSENDEMDPKEKKEMTEDITKAVLEGIDKAQAEKDKKASEAAEKIKKEESTKGLGWDAPELKKGATDEELQQHAKNLQIYELSKAVDTTDMDSIYKFNSLKKKIIDGEDVKIEKEDDKSPYSAFHSNQGTNINKSSDGDDPYGDAILADIAKEEKAGN